MANIVAGNVFNLVLNVGIQDTSILSAAIDYVNPNGVSGRWIASAVSGQQQIEYLVQSTDMAVEGQWKIQAWVVTVDGGSHGDPIEIFVNKTIRPAGHIH